ncbi:hypothetical protein V5F53_21250, partial [Xanthobacter sp. V4C-4]
MRFLFLDLAGDDGLTRGANALARGLAAAGAQVVCVGVDRLGTPAADERGVVRLPGLGVPVRQDGAAGDPALALTAFRQARARALVARLRPDLVVATAADGADDDAATAAAADLGAGSRARWAALLAAGADGPRLVFDGRVRPDAG